MNINEALKVEIRARTLKRGLTVFEDEVSELAQSLENYVLRAIEHRLPLNSEGN